MTFFPRAIRPRKRLALLLYPALALGAAAIAWATIAAVSGPAPAAPPDSPGAVVPSPGQQTGPLPVKGRLSFPRTEYLTFGASGKVGDVSVEAGERVMRGQTLATLDATSTARLEAAAEGAALKVVLAEEALDTTAPALEMARAKSEEANASHALDQAREALDELVYPEGVTVAAAKAAVAKARVDLKAANDGLKELERHHSRRVSLGRRALAQAQSDLGRAWNALADLDAQFPQRLEQAVQTVAMAQLNLDQAREDLEDFDLDEDRAGNLAGARQASCRRQRPAGPGAGSPGRFPRQSCLETGAGAGEAERRRPVPGRRPALPWPISTRSTPKGWPPPCRPGPAPAPPWTGPRTLWQTWNWSTRKGWPRPSCPTARPR